MNNPPKIVTASEMDLMTPNERAAVVEAGIVRNLDDVAEPFRSRIIAKAHDLEERLYGAASTK